MGNNHTNGHQAQFVRLRLPFFSDSEGQVWRSAYLLFLTVLHSRVRL